MNDVTGVFNKRRLQHTHMLLCAQLKPRNIPKVSAYVFYNNITEIFIVMMSQLLSIKAL